SSCGSSSSSSRRHSLYVSFRYRRTVLHYESKVQLKELYREGLRRPVFYSEPKQFEQTQVLVGTFVPKLRTWLEAIVKAANFMDQDAMSVDLQDLLRARHHAILTRRSAQHVGVMLCKLEQDSRKLASLGVVFNFEELQIHDDDQNELESFQDVFQQFIGLHPGLPLEPLPAEEEEDPAVTMNLLEGLSDQAPTEIRRHKLLRWQAALRRLASAGGPLVPEQPSLEVLELATTLLLPQLLHSKALSFSAGSDSARSCPAFDMSDQAFGHMAPMPNVALGELEVLLCDILAELCDLYPKHICPLLWRLFREYLKDPGHWHSCLLVLALLTRLSSQLSSWLPVDAVCCLFDVLRQVQEQLTHRREEVLTATGRLTRLHSPHVLSHRETPLSSARSVRTSARPMSSDWPSPWSPRQKLTESSERPLSVRSGMHRYTSDHASSSASSPALRSASFDGESPWASLRDVAGPVRWPMEKRGNLEDLPRLKSTGSRPSVPPLNLAAAKCAAGSEGTPTTQRLKTQSSSRLSRRLKMEAQAQRTPLPSRLSASFFFGACTTATSPPPSNPNDVFTETGRFTVTPFVGLKRPLLSRVCPAASGGGRAPVQTGDDLAKNLGESCLLADLGPLLRMKQEKAVQDAVAARSGSSNASIASGSDAQQTSTAYANRIGSQESLPSLCTPTPRDSQVTSRRQMPYRCIRLNICLVLERICNSIPPGGAAMFEVPVSQIYEMVHASCSRAGACSFDLGKHNENSEAEEVTWPQTSRLLGCLAPRRASALRRLAQRLWRCAGIQRCVCGADSGRADDPCSPCTCLDDATAACLWRLLAEHARQVELALAQSSKHVPCPHFHELDATAEAEATDREGASCDAQDYHCSAQKFLQRLRLDSFLSFLATSLRQLLWKLKASLKAGTAGPEVTRNFQLQLARSLQLAAQYLRSMPGRLLPHLAAQVLAAPLVALKGHLASSAWGPLAAAPRGDGQTSCALRLWASYLELVGVLLRGAVRSGGIGCQLGHLLMVMLLDFPCPLGQRASMLSLPSARAFKMPSSRSQAESSAEAPSRPSSGLFTLCSGPVNQPGPVRAAGAKTAPKVSSFWDSLPKIVERLLQEKAEPLSLETLQCCTLSFVEALLDFAKALTECKECGNSRAGDSAPEAARALAGSEAMLQKLLEWFQFLFLPPSGLICKLGGATASASLMRRVVSCERALFSAPMVSNSVYARKYSVLEHYVRRHFLAFVALYNSRRGGSMEEAQCIAACRLHLETLLAIAGLDMDDHLTRRVFLQLSVLDFFVGEIELEHVTAQMQQNFLRRQNKAGSAWPTPQDSVESPSVPSQPSEMSAAQVKSTQVPVPRNPRPRPVAPLMLAGLPASMQGTDTEN
ncbi:ZNF470, partial [Symbiodinium sp. CCMP2456]